MPTYIIFELFAVRPYDESTSADGRYFRRFDGSVCALCRAAFVLYGPDVNVPRSGGNNIVLQPWLAKIGLQNMIQKNDLHTWSKTEFVMNAPSEPFALV